MKKTSSNNDEKNQIFIFVANKGGVGKTLFSLVTILDGYFNGKTVASIDLNFENPDTATILNSIKATKMENEDIIVNKGTKLAYHEEKINDRLYSIRPVDLYNVIPLFTFLDNFLYQNKNRFDVIVVDTCYNLTNLNPPENEKWPRTRPVPTIMQLYSFSSGLKPWELDAFDKTIKRLKSFFNENFDKQNLVHVLNPQAFIPKTLGANLKYLYRAKYQFEGADKMISNMRKISKKGMFEMIDWDTFKKEILLEVRKEFWRRPLGEFWKDEIPSIWLDVMNGFLKRRKSIPTNIFFHPYVYHQIQLLVDDLIIRRGKDLEDIKEIVEPVYENYQKFKEYFINTPNLIK
ncbi:MAG: hypothetical protein ACTSVI_14650 [Promethearchaeota archaeon]